MFYNCSSLLSLPDISKWDTINITDMHKIFYNCSSLSSLPDISKWNTENVTNMSKMFYNCISLPNLHNISRWDIKKGIKKENMFFNCISLLSFPNLMDRDSFIKEALSKTFITPFIKNMFKNTYTYNKKDSESFNIFEESLYIPKKKVLNIKI